MKDSEIRKIALIALIGALEIGWEKDLGGILYMMDIEGKPLMDTTVTAENKLWWPMSEGKIKKTFLTPTPAGSDHVFFFDLKKALYATILAYEETKEIQYLDWCEKLWKYIDEHFIDHENGGDWFGYLRRDGTVFNRLKVELV